MENQRKRKFYVEKLKVIFPAEASTQEEMVFAINKIKQHTLDQAVLQFMMKTSMET